MSGEAEAAALRIKGVDDRQFRTIFTLARMTSGDEVFARVDRLAEMMECGEMEAGMRVGEVCAAGLLAPLALRNAPDPATSEPHLSLTGKFRIGPFATVRQ